MPNVEHINELIETIKPLAVGSHAGEFNMSNWKHAGHSCGTPSCMAGWAAWIVEGRPTGSMKTYSSGCQNVAASYLGITEEQSDELFIPFDTETTDGLDTNNIQPRHAVAVLEHLRDTGEVDWGFAGLPKQDDEPYYYDDVDE